MGNKAHKRSPVLKICSNCGKQFCYRGSHSSRNKNFFCCYECYIEFKTKRMKVKCDYCGTIFEKKRSDIKRSNHNFCSQECNLSFRHKQGEGTINHTPVVWILVEGRLTLSNQIYSKIAEKSHHCHSKITSKPPQ